jgi:hypothetical protein
MISSQQRPLLLRLIRNFKGVLLSHEEAHMIDVEFTFIRENIDSNSLLTFRLFLEETNQVGVWSHHVFIDGVDKLPSGTEAARLVRDPLNAVDDFLSMIRAVLLASPEEMYWPNGDLYIKGLSPMEQMRDLMSRLPPKPT